jgi:hypothetical protein
MMGRLRSAPVSMLIAAGAAWFLSSTEATAQSTPIAGHYPPGQSGIRGAAALAPGWGYTNFSRFFSNLEIRDPQGDPFQDVDEIRYANISMLTWTTSHRVAGMAYGAIVGVPFSTGNLNPSSDDVGSSTFGLGDILLTPVALYGSQPKLDYTAQFTVWTASGRFEPGSSNNRGAGFWSLVYSLGAVAYPGSERLWSASALARIEQNLEQSKTGITPGDDVVIDWGIGRRIPRHGLDVGASGFATWQLSDQTGGPGPTPAPYRYFGAGPEGTLALSDRVSARLRAHWEFGTKSAVQGNNLWILFHVKL